MKLPATLQFRLEVTKLSTFLGKPQLHYKPSILQLLRGPYKPEACHRQFTTRRQSPAPTASYPSIAMSANVTPLATIGVLSIGDMGLGIAKRLKATGFSVVTNCQGRR